MSAEFTFDVSVPATSAELLPLYQRLLGHDTSKPTISFGAASKEDGEAWLRDGHVVYAEKVGKRSSLLQKMDLVERVEIVADET